MDVTAADPLVTADWLESRLAEPEIRVLDATWYLPGTGRDGRSAYCEAHIPGAQFFDIDALSDGDSPLPHMLPPPGMFEEAARALGVRSTSKVIVYDAHGLFSAPRVWWMFRVMGHKNVAVLDGGLSHWRAKGRPVRSGAEGAPTRGDFQARPVSGLVQGLESVREALRSGGAQVVDARGADRFFGLSPEPRSGVRPGHMPGAINIPYSNLAPGGRLADPASLRRIFASANVDLQRPVITTCGSGITAAIPLLALARLGCWDASLYDGSWAEWGARTDTSAEVESGGNPTDG